ncbi:MAG: type II secretion system protein [Burkholderiaceae bacterium]|jgi:prepilin-type N-terminal cleavage/methylation domain-containing protein
MRDRYKLQTKTLRGYRSFGSATSGFTLVEVLISILLISLAVSYSVTSIIGVVKGVNEDKAANLSANASAAVKNRLEQYIIDQVSIGSTSIPMAFDGACGTEDRMNQLMCAANTDMGAALKTQISSSLTLQYLGASNLSSQYCYVNVRFTVRNDSTSQQILQRNFVVNCNAKKV